VARLEPLVQGVSLVSRRGRSLECRAEIRVLIADEEQMLAEMLASLLEADAGHPSLVVVGTTGSVTDSVALAAQLKPDVVVANVKFSDGSVVDLASQVRASSANTAIVLLATPETDEVLAEMVRAGVSAVVPRNRRVAELVQTVRRAADGEMLIPADTLARLIARVRNHSADLPEYEPLTEREMEILRLMADGLSNLVIAERLQIEYSTIRTHVQHILRKVGARSRLSAVVRASSFGLLVLG
jgi:DNA-binding NarL/FixJ family response regulator